MIDRNELLEYQFVRENFTVPMDKWEIVYNTFHFMSERHIYLDYITLELIRTYTKSFADFMLVIRVMFCHPPEYDYDLSIYGIVLIKLSEICNKEKNKFRNNYFKDIIDIINKYSLSVNIEGNLIFLLLGYYWENKDIITINDIDELLYKIKILKYEEFFINDGILFDNGKLRVDIDTFIRYVNKLLKRKKEIIKIK